MLVRILRAAIAWPCFAALVLLAACAPTPDRIEVNRADLEAARLATMYGPMEDHGRLIPAVDPEYLSEARARQQVSYPWDDAPGTIVVDPYAFRLYLVEPGNTATRYTVAVGEAGRNFRGGATIRRKGIWPSWTPTANMIRREPETYGPFAGGVPGGLENPLGARALYLYRGGRDTYYRIHGTSQPWTIGTAVSSGCIRLWNQDAIDLYQRVSLGTRVTVLTEAESLARAGDSRTSGLMASLDTRPLGAVSAH